MNTTKHTPGPWVVKDGNTVIGPSGNVVAECCGYSVKATDKDQQRQGGREANAHLIAAAPAMYEAIKAALDYYRGVFTGNTVTDEMMSSKLEQALAQAEGRQS